MDLGQMSSNIKLAKLDNARWLSYANALIHGDKVSKEAIPSYRDSCISCQWLYDHSEEVTKVFKSADRDQLDFFHFDIMEEIEILRYDLSANYLVVFKTYFFEINHLFFASIFNLYKQMTDVEKKEAQKAYQTMQEIVKELDCKLDELERSIYQVCHLHSA